MKNIKVTTQMNLIIERDKGNEIAINMGGSIKQKYENWKLLKKIADLTLEHIEIEFAEELGLKRDPEDD